MALEMSKHLLTVVNVYNKLLNINRIFSNKVVFYCVRLPSSKNKQPIKLNRSASNQFVIGSIKGLGESCIKDVLSANQFVFRAYCSTTTSLPNVTQNIMIVMDIKIWQQSKSVLITLRLLIYQKNYTMQALMNIVLFLLQSHCKKKLPLTYK